jgi:hypothetical protein
MASVTETVGPTPDDGSYDDLDMPAGQAAVVDLVTPPGLVATVSRSCDHATGDDSDTGDTADPTTAPVVTELHIGPSPTAQSCEIDVTPISGQGDVQLLVRPG